MTAIDKEYCAWEKKTFGNGALPQWKEIKVLYAEYLATTKTKSQIWKMLCGPATGPCHCNCLCPAGIAWNTLLAREQQEK